MKKKKNKKSGCAVRTKPYDRNSFGKEKKSDEHSYSIVNDRYSRSSSGRF